MGGTPIFSGNTFTTGSLISNTTYFIEENSCGVAAPRTAVSITVQVCTYISESQAVANSILIYPNPTSDFIYIENNGINSFQILNALGEIVTEFITSSDKIIEIDISALSSGIYFVKGKRQDRTFSVKILVRNESNKGTFTNAHFASTCVALLRRQKNLFWRHKSLQTQSDRKKNWC
ncbi:MAG: T9SS type A sorting domain-containing protein [Sphingobacteriaceae bacterium]|nr:T9SS type A sorting domain-containing protein [Sphingobacteriaceae bacterium]